MYHFLIATANYADSVRVKMQVRKILATASIKENDDCVVQEFSTRDALRSYLLDNGFLNISMFGSDQTGQIAERDHVLVIAQPTLTDMEDTKPVLTQLLRRSHDSVILLRLNNTGLGGLPINSDRILNNLGDSAMTQLRALIEQFLKDHEFLEYNKYVRRLDEFKKTRLTPIQTSGDSMGDDIDSHINHISNIEREWASLAKGLEQKAELMLQRAVTNFVKSGARDTSDLSLSAAFLHLWVETQFYGIRAKTNYQVFVNAHSKLNENQRRLRLGRIPRGFGVSQNERADVEKAILGITKSYFGTLKKYDKVLQVHARNWKYFVRKSGDAEQFRVWSEEFGPKNVNSAIEPGWDVHADRVSHLLFVRYREAIGRERAQDARTRGLGMHQLYWIVAGFGFAPERVILIILSILTLASGAQFADDYFSGCLSQTKFVNTPWGWIQNIGFYFHVSITSVTSMGTVATPCGPFHEVISGIETLFGYFLLAILTTMFVQSILER